MGRYSTAGGRMVSSTSNTAGFHDSRERSLSMLPTQSSNQRPDYGIDAPGLLRGMAGGGAAAAVVALGLTASPWRGRTATVVVTVIAAACAVYLLSMASYMWFGSRVAKVRGRERLLDLVPWSGGETVLDVGCGRGLMLVGAAKRLTTGRAVGIDLWQAEDQSANHADGPVLNAGLEGVKDRVTVETADMRRLPFADGSFDVVVSPRCAMSASTTWPPGRRTRTISPRAVARSAATYKLWTAQWEYAARLASLGLDGVRMVVSPAGDAIRAALTFGSFRPAAVVARKPAA